MDSIRSKILFAYFGLATGLVAVALFAWADLRFVERTIAQGSRIAVLREHAGEMRRHEKNTLLYRLADERDQALERADRLRVALAATDTTAGGLLDVATRQALHGELDDYRQLISRIDTVTPAGRPAGRTAQATESALRAVGHRISAQIDQLAERGNTALAAALETARRALLFFVSVVLLLALLVAFSLIRAVVRPLRQLERNLRPLAEGRFDALPQVSADREMVSLVHALRRMFDELEQRRRQVLQSEKLASLGVLAAGVAHELNNPLGNISAAAQILQEEAARPEPSDLGIWTRQIDAEALRAQAIVRTLLDYAQRPPLVAGPVRLDAVIDKALQLLRSRFPAVAAVELDLAAEAEVNADPQRLQQVFINLLGNALAMDRAPATLQVRIEGRLGRAAPPDWPPSPDAFVVGALPPGQALLRVAVSDNGPGIAPELWPRIFDPFFTTREPGQGVGLGLFVVVEILQEHGAAIAVDRSPSGGARFCLAFPIAAGAAR